MLSVIRLCGVQAKRFWPGQPLLKTVTETATLDGKRVVSRKLDFPRLIIN
jgi:hypothetical protein